MSEQLGYTRSDREFMARDVTENTSGCHGKSDVTENVTENVTKKRGRPRSGDAMTAKERKQAQRARGE